MKRLSIEHLESRQLLTRLVPTGPTLETFDAFFDINVQDGVIVVGGTDGSDQISIRRDGTEIEVSAQSNVSHAADRTFRVDADSIRSIDVRGEDGDDVISNHTDLPMNAYGGNGADTITGGDGEDQLFGENGRDILRGGDGEDTIEGGDGDDWIDGGAATDVLFGGSGNDTVLGGTGNDLLFGDDGNDILRGDGGRDNVNGDAGNDTLYGGPEADALAGGYGRDAYPDAPDDEIWEGNSSAAGGVFAAAVGGSLPSGVVIDDEATQQDDVVTSASNLVAAMVVSLQDRPAAVDALMEQLDWHSSTSPERGAGVMGVLVEEQDLVPGSTVQPY